ncbi:MAG: arylsulfatase [Protaetiibacter sp.]
MPHRPHVVVVVFDDLGYADFGCYGSSIRTPHVDALAERGIRYTGFDVTPLCSPTRAALLTGRNPHTVGMGTIVQFATGDPGYTGFVPADTAMLPAMLAPAGYSSGLFGKWHLSPNAESGPGGPYRRWPLAYGFDRFFGYLSGRVHQFRPELVSDNTVLDAAGAGGRHISELIVDEATTWIADHRYARPDDPFFAMISFGAVHSPHHAPEEYLARTRGEYRHGWDVERVRRFERQQQLGVLPPGTRLAPADPQVPGWDALDAEERAVAERLMEAYAAHLEHADAELGRFLASLASLGCLDDTIVVVMSDNGATNAGGPHGALSEEAVLNDAPGDSVIVDLDAIGGPAYYNQYPAGWGQASNTPFRRYKQTVHNGGTRSPLVIAGPDVAEGRIERSTAFVTDIVPTLLERIGIEAPPTVGGVPQRPIQGRSIAASLDGSTAPPPRGPQYFEVGGHRAIVAEGWKAVTFHAPGADFDSDRWELYDLTDDPAETRDLASEHPDRLARLIELWWSEAEANQVLPLAARGKAQLVRDRPERTRWVFVPEMTAVPQAAAPEISGHDTTITIETAPIEPGSRGVLMAMGDSFGGLSVALLDERLTFTVNALGTLTSVELPAGAHHGATRVRAGLLLLPEGGAELQLATDARPVAAAAVADWVPRLRFFMGTAQCGRDQPHAVSTAYTGPFPYTGRIAHAVVEIHPDARHGDVEALARHLMEQ